MTSTRSPLLTRMAVTGAVVSVLCVQSPAIARAEGVTLDPLLCQAAPATPSTKIPPMWHLDRLNLQQVWKLPTRTGSTDGSGVTIAVVDTGVSNVNSALLNREQITTLNYLPLDDEESLRPRSTGDNKQGISCTHGTGVTSVIVGTPGIDSRTSYSGIAPGAKVIAMRALKSSVTEEGASEKEDPRYTVAAINDAVARKVDIINISQAMSDGTPEYAAAIKRAIDAGIVVVAAAGNKSQGLVGPAYPAAYPGVIAVGMSDPQDVAPTETAYADDHFRITVAAPGVGVLALGPTMAPARGKTSQADLLANQSYISQSGTSFAAPIVTGVVALMLQRNPQLTPAQVKQRLMETADPPVGSIPDPYLGNGVVNPMRALTGPAVPSAAHPSSSQSMEPIQPRETTPTDRRPMWAALTAAGVAATLAGGGLLLKLVIPLADKRGYRPAKRRP